MSAADINADGERILAVVIYVLLNCTVKGFTTCVLHAWREEKL